MMLLVTSCSARYRAFSGLHADMGSQLAAPGVVVNGVQPHGMTPQCRCHQLGMSLIRVQADGSQHQQVCHGCRGTSPSPFLDTAGWQQPRLYLHRPDDDLPP